MNNFYKNNNLIIETEFSVPWTPRGFGSVENSFHVKSKIGLKGKIGVNKIKEKKVFFGDFYFLDNLSNNYKIDNSILNNFKKLEGYLNNYFLENKINFGLEISFLSDIARGHGFGFSGIFSSLLATSIFFLSGKVDDISDDLIKNKELINFSINLENILRNKNTNGLNSLATFIKSKSPILYYTNNNKLNYNNFIKKDFNFPVDYYVIFSGISTNTDKIEKLISKNGKEINNISNFILNKSKHLNLENHYLEKFSNKKFLNNNFENLFNFINLKIINNFEIFDSEIYDNRNIEDFIRNIDEYRKLNNIAGDYSDFLNTFEKSFYNNKKSLKNNIGILPIYGGKIGGGYLVVSKENTNRSIIKKTIEDISIYYANSYIEYCNYKDNKKIEGIKLIQNIEKNIFHKSLIGKKYKLKTKNKTIIVDNISEVLNKNIDIIVDKNKEKVYINGVKLTSKDIHSQSILSEVLVKLFKSENNIISNKILNRSSYSQNKALMGSKVIYPFKKLILEKLGKDIDFNIKGIGGEYSIELDYEYLNIVIFEKV